MRACRSSPTGRFKRHNSKVVHLKAAVTLPTKLDLDTTKLVYSATVFTLYPNYIYNTQSRIVRGLLSVKRFACAGAPATACTAVSKPRISAAPHLRERACTRSVGLPVITAQPKREARLPHLQSRCNRLRLSLHGSYTPAFCVRVVCILRAPQCWVKCEYRCFK